MAIVAAIVSAPVAGIAVWSIGHTVLELLDPTVRWEPSASGRGGVSRSVTAGRNQTVTVIGESKSKAIAVSALIPGGVLLSALLAVTGAACRRPWMIAVAAVVMLVETPLTYSIAPLTLVTGVLYLVFAVRVTAPSGRGSV